MGLPFDPDRLPTSATGAVNIDLGAIASNWRALAAMVSPAECAAVVKADAYGLGASQVVPALAAAGCRTFFVATVGEADEVRRHVPAAVIYVLDGLGCSGTADLFSIEARPVLCAREDLSAWVGAVLQRRQDLPAAIQLDTGLHRLGLSRDDVLEIARDHTLLQRIPIALVMSHLACADDPEHPMNAAQLAHFHELSALLPAAPRSLAASDGLMLGNDYHFDLVRPGYALYGGQAFKGGSAPVRPVVEVHARVLQVHDVPAGGTVGYSATWRAGSRRTIATIAAGYADGVFRHASSSADETHGYVAIDGHRCPIVGRVSMDLITVDVTDLPMGASDVGSWTWAELIGPNISIEEVGARAGTIGYEVLTRLGRRFHRVYRSA